MGFYVIAFLFIFQNAVYSLKREAVSLSASRGAI